MTDVDLLTPAYWPEVRRGTERVAHDLATGLAARRHRVRLVTSHPGRATRAREDGVAVLRVRRPPDGRLTRRLFEGHLTHLPLAYAALERRGPDLAHAFFHTDALVATRWAARHGRPSVFSFMGLPHRRGLADRRWRLASVLRATREASAVVALSDAAAAGFRRWLGVDARVIHPGVDLDAFRPGGERAEHPTIVCPAALSTPNKRAGLLLEAFALVRREHPRARLILHGAAPAAGAPPGVEHRDLDDHAALLAAYREAWVCGLASIGEAFGLVLAEALACGTPAVGSDDGGAPEVIGDAGATFAGDDPRALAGALLAAFDGPSAQACRAQAERFSLDRCVAAHEALYGALLQGP